MEQGPFGSHPTHVSRLGLGCSKLSPLSGTTRFASVRNVVNRSVDRGITFFDTADSYGAGWSERWLGRALGAKRHEVMIATKCGRPATLTGKVLDRFPRAGRLPLLPALDRNHLFSSRYIESALQHSLRRLGTEYVDVLLLHSPPADVLSDGSWAEAFAKLRDRGLIRFCGIAARSPEDAARVIRDYEVDCVELELNPCTTAKAEPTLALAREHGTAVIARQVLGSGRLLDSVVSRMSNSHADERRRQTAAALMQFVLAMPDVSVTLVGMSNVGHVEANTSPSTPTAEFISEVVEVARRVCASEDATTS